VGHLVTRFFFEKGFMDSVRPSGAKLGPAPLTNTARALLSPLAALGERVRLASCFAKALSTVFRRSVRNDCMLLVHSNEVFPLDDLSNVCHETGDHDGFNSWPNFIIGR